MVDLENSRWSETIRRMLERAGYDLSSAESRHEIKARTELDEHEVTQVLDGSRHATVEGLYRIAAMLNVPASDLINQTNSIFQCYSIDGGRPRTISLAAEDTALIRRGLDQPLLYAEDLDGSYGLLPSKAIVVFVNKHETPVVDSLYLFENQNSRYVRRCAFIDVSSGDAAMSDDRDAAKITMVKVSKLKRVGANKDVLMGRVIVSLTMH